MAGNTFHIQATNHPIDIRQGTSGKLVKAGCSSSHPAPLPFFPQKESMELNPIGTVIEKDGMVFTVTGHGINHVGKPSEIVSFTGVAQTTKVRKPRQQKVSARPQTNLTGAVTSSSLKENLAAKCSVASKKAPPERFHRKPDFLPMKQEKTENTAPYAFLVVLGIAIVIFIMASTSKSSSSSYYGPPINVTHKR